MKELSQLEVILSDISKPEHFCDYRHCEECHEHDETLKNATRESIGLEELGNPGWDPICFINSAQGFQYYLPALARLATGRDNQYYLGQFLFHLNQDRINDLPDNARKSLKAFLESLVNEMPEEIEANYDSDEILNKITELGVNGV